MKDIKEIVVTLRKVSTIKVIVSEERGYDMPTNIMEAHGMLTNINNDITSYIEDVDLAEAVDEYIIDNIKVIEE